eukprot:tig00020902_g14963.t1
MYSARRRARGAFRLRGRPGLAPDLEPDRRASARGRDRGRLCSAPGSHGPELASSSASASASASASGSCLRLRPAPALALQLAPAPAPGRCALRASGSAASLLRADLHRLRPDRFSPVPARGRDRGRGPRRRTGLAFVRGPRPCLAPAPAPRRRHLSSAFGRFGSSPARGRLPAGPRPLAAPGAGRRDPAAAPKVQARPPEEAEHEGSRGWARTGDNHAPAAAAAAATVAGLEGF